MWFLRLDDDERFKVSGRVASVKLQNFMCHANLLIEFNTEKNNCFYIGGPNGSGKSALFAAINLGLGGRGSDNDRGNTVKAYIKDGTSQAKITITLTNEGLNAHPDFDELISVERTINQTSSTYVMKSIRVGPNGHQSERVISKKKSEIDRIVARFNIHLSNPAFWMSQDRSRSFLANFKPSNVYKLYLESTDLEKIRLSYMRFASVLEECKGITEEKIGDMAKEQRRLKNMLEQRELQEKVENDKATLASYKWKIIFCTLRDFEDEIKLNERKLEVQKQFHETLKKDYGQNRTERNALDKKAHDLTEEVEVQKDEMEEAVRNQKTANQAVKEFEEKIKEFVHEKNTKEYELKSKKDAILNAEKHLRQAMQKQGCEDITNRLEKAENESKAVSAEREKMELGGQLDKLKETADEIKREIGKKDVDKVNSMREIYEIRRELENNMSLMTRAKAMKTDSINKFGRHMSDILKEISRNQSKFEKLPKGPIGKYITLTDPKWAIPAEDCLRHVASMFLCSSHRDSDTLRKCFRDLSISNDEQPAVVIANFLGKPYSNLMEPNAEYDTIYRKLEISDPDVHNLIVDKTSCESIILIEQKLDAMRIMDSDHPPQNAVKAYTCDGGQAYAGGPTGQYRFYGGKPRRDAGRLFGPQSANLDEKSLIKDIEMAKTEIENRERNVVRKIDEEMRQLKKDEYEARSALENFEKKLTSLRSQELKMDRLVRDLSEQLRNSAEAESVEALQHQIDAQRNHIPAIEDAIRELDEKVLEIRQSMAPALREKSGVDKLLTKMKVEVRGFAERTTKLQAEMSALDEKGDELKLRIDKLKGDETVLYTNDARLKTEMDEAIAQVEAEKKNPENAMPPGETDPPDLSDFPPTKDAVQRIEELQKKIDLGTNGCDMSITAKSIADFQKKIKICKYQCRKVNEAYPLLKKYTEMKVCDKFEDLLAIRGNFKGHLEFDHEKQTLNVDVQSTKENDPMSQRDRGNDEEDDDEEVSENSDDRDSDGPRRKKAKKQPKKKKKARDLKGLSGGERSFVTAALVMSLWEVMEQPFRMMDEFDVFMDMMNRKLVMDLLVELATQKFPHNQFIFFTPQGIKELNKVDGLQIFEMNKNIEKRVATLPHCPFYLSPTFLLLIQPLKMFRYGMAWTAHAQTYDRGMRSSLPEQLGTVAKLSRLFEENPIPVFVNNILVRTADSFKDGNLDLRIAIARSLGQCGSHLTLAFSVDQIFKRILTVIHSNDPNARETVLDVLAVLCPLNPEHNQCHHLICESLSTSHEGEFRAACAALKAFAAHSQTFAETTVLQIGKILEDEDAPENRKIHLCSAISTMSATAQVVEQVFGLADTVLRRTISDDYFFAFLDATTSLCVEIRFAIPRQIDLLLTLLNSTEKDRRKPSKARKLAVLKQLKRLSSYSNIWTERQIKLFVSALNPSLPDRSLVAFFDTVVHLAKNCPHPNLMALKNMVIANTSFGTVANPEVSVRFVHLAAQVLSSPRAFEDEPSESIESTMTAITVVVVSACNCGKLETSLANRMFRAVGDFLIAFPYSQHAFSKMIISTVFSAFESPVHDDNNQKERLEMICRLVDSEKKYIPEVHKWACGVMRDKKELFQSYPKQFAYLCLAVGTELPAESEKVFYKHSSLAMYETAMSALRNGHWKSVAAPNLASIDLYNLDRCEREWLAALLAVAESQMSEMSLEALEHQETYLISALSNLKTARTSPRMEKVVQFPIQIVSAMLSTSRALYHLHSVIVPFTTYLSGALEPNDFFNPVVAKRFLVALNNCEVTVADALAEWTALCRASFCADPTSFDLITLFCLRVSVLSVAVKVMLKKQSPDTLVQIPPLSNNRTCSALQRERIQWIADRIRFLRYDGVPNIKLINSFHRVIEQIAMTPYMLPRFYFQQFYNVDIKISTCPEGTKSKPFSIGSGETVPIRVDGAIISTHPSQIRSVIVFADIINPANHSYNHTLQETVLPNESNYFNAQFLLTFKTSCEVKFRIEFVDQISRKQWKSDGGETILVNVREIVPSVPQERRSGPPPATFTRSIFYPSDTTL
ncbi:unnamed protein product [Caenorhabditis sp. 36 PRJEB53466]|nr:unnamed protein product [Caenorhabditis sp. 36 PRJEB53466]